MPMEMLALPGWPGKAYPKHTTPVNCSQAKLVWALCKRQKLLKIHLESKLPKPSESFSQTHHGLISLCFSLSLCLCVSFCLSLCLSVCLFLSLSLFVSVCLLVYLCLSVCLSLGVYLSVSLYLFVCLSLSVNKSLLCRPIETLKQIASTYVHISVNKRLLRNQWLEREGHSASVTHEMLIDLKSRTLTFHASCGPINVLRGILSSV